jgi:hypothetical protein
LDGVEKGMVDIQGMVGGSISVSFVSIRWRLCYDFVKASRRVASLLAPASKRFA